MYYYLAPKKRIDIAAKALNVASKLNKTLTSKVFNYYLHCFAHLN